jgi:hypothetical protein
MAASARSVSPVRDPGEELLDMVEYGAVRLGEDGDPLTRNLCELRTRDVLG